MPEQAGFFDLSNQYEALSTAGDLLARFAILTRRISPAPQRFFEASIHFTEI